MPAAPAVAPKTEIFFEFRRGKLKDELKAGKKPERIFSSDDERWAEIEELSKTRPIVGNLIVGTMTRVGEDFVEGSLKVSHHLTSQRHDKAREKMRLYETDGRWGSTQYADAMREAEEEKRAGREQSERLTKAMEQLAANLSKSGGGK